MNLMDSRYIHYTNVLYTFEILIKFVVLKLFVYASNV